MKATIVTLALMMFMKVTAGEHSLESHEHGAIKVGMAVEKNKIIIDIDGPSESFLGFEYAPKTQKEKKTFSDLEAQWTKNLESLIAFDPKLKCLTSETSFKQVIDQKVSKAASKKEAGVHSEIEASAVVTCAQDLSGSDVTISLRKVFKHIKKLSVEIVGNETKSIEITKPVQSFKI